MFEITITYKSLIPIIGSTTAGEIALPVFEPNAAMPNGGHASPWSCPHTSDDEEIWAEKMRFRVLGARVVKRWKLLVARNKRARASEERRRRHIFLSSTESESPIRGRQHGSRSRSPLSSGFVNGRSIGPIFDLGWNIGLIDYDIEESQGFGD